MARCAQLFFAMLAFQLVSHCFNCLSGCCCSRQRQKRRADRIEAEAETVRLARQAHNDRTGQGHSHRGTTGGTLGAPVLVGTYGYDPFGCSGYGDYPGYAGADGCEGCISCDDCCAGCGCEACCTSCCEALAPACEGMGECIAQCCIHTVTLPLAMFGDSLSKSRHRGHLRRQHGSRYDGLRRYDALELGKDESETDEQRAFEERVQMRRKRMAYNLRHM